MHDSLATIRAEAEGVAQSQLADWLARSTAIIGTGHPRVRPALWAIYAALCDAISKDDIGAATAAAAELHGALRAPPAPYVSNLDDRDLGDGYAALYKRALDDDDERPLDLVAVDPEDTVRARTLIAQARELIGETCPDLLAEMDALVREIVLVRERPGGNQFAGAATLFLWGAIFVNPTLVRDRLGMAEALTHEAAHALLTGLTEGHDLTLNDRQERYASPLREDPRPMEGIAHAAFVLARMTMMLDRLAGSPSIDADERARLATMRAENARLFESALPTLKRHAALTPAGTAIFAACESYMAATAT